MMVRMRRMLSVLNVGYLRLLLLLSLLLLSDAVMMIAVAIVAAAAVAYRQKVFVGDDVRLWIGGRDLAKTCI